MTLWFSSTIKEEKKLLEMREHYSTYKVLKMDTRFAVVAALLCCLTVEGQPVPSLLDNTTLPVIYPGKILDGEEQVCPVQEVIRDEVIESVRAILRNLSELIPQGILAEHCGECESVRTYATA